MKKLYLLLVLIAVAAMAALSCQRDSNPVGATFSEDAVLAAKGGKKAGCNTIQDGLIYSSTGELVVTGYDKWGYNYQSHMFNGLYENNSRPDPPVTESDTKLIMKWNDAWLSNMDCDDPPDGKLDRHFGFPSYIGSGAWLTNHQSGVDNGKKWTYFVKIVAAPADAYSEGGYWYTADGTEIGEVIWGAFAVIQVVENDKGLGVHGAQYVSPAGAGFGKYKP